MTKQEILDVHSLLNEAQRSLETVRDLNDVLRSQLQQVGKYAICRECRRAFIDVEADTTLESEPYRDINDA